MKIETIAIGDELLTGKIADTNSAFVAEQLFRRGLRLDSISVIPDTIPALHEKMNERGGVADVVICFGGLGPTSDDKTAEAVATLVGGDIVIHEPSKKKMLEFYKERGRQVLPAAMKQVHFPEKSEALPNEKGMAPGFTVRHKKCQFFFLPGVPMEMKTMFAQEVLPRMKVGDAEILSHQWKCLGIWESELQSKMDAVEKALPPHAYLGYRTRFPENHLTLYWRPLQNDKSSFEAWVAKIRAILSPYTYTEKPDELETLVLDQLKLRGDRIAFAESCTGGLAAHRLTQIPGASAQVWGGVTTYRLEAKAKLLGVHVESEEAAVSAKCARDMAEAIARVSGCAVGAAITGFMGPTGGTEENPAGTVYLCVVGYGNIVEKRFILSTRERAQTQWGAATNLLAAVLTLLETSEKK